MVDSRGHVDINTGVQVRQHQSFDWQVLLLYLLGSLLVVIEFLKCFPKLIRLDVWVRLNFVVPNQRHLAFQVIARVNSSWDKSEHFLSMSLDREQVVITNDNLKEFSLEVLVGFRKSWVHRVVELESICVFISNSDVAVLDDSWTHVVAHLPSFFVANPSVNTTTSGEHPQQVWEVKVFRADVLNDLHGNFEVGKAALTHIGALAASSYIIVVVHVNIENHFFGGRHKSLFVACIMAIWRNIVNSSNIDLMRYSFAKNLSEVLGIFKAKVPAVDVVGKGERKLSLVEICRVGSVVEAGQC